MRERLSTANILDQSLNGRAIAELMGEDEDMARAIALSLQESRGQGGSAPQRPIVIDEDEEDDGDTSYLADLKRAIEASRAESRSRQQNGVQGGLPQAQTPVQQRADEQTSKNTFLSERAQLEKERLERQKRLRGEGNGDKGQSGDGAAKRMRYSDSSGSSSSSSSPRNPPSASTTSSTLSSTTARNDQGPLFWDGELRQTANKHVDPKKDTRLTWRLSEIVGDKSSITLAVLSSFAASPSWLYQFFAPSTPVLLVCQPPAGQDSQEPYLKNGMPNWVHVYPRLRGGYGCMHMKFMLLFYKTGRLRVVVSTANFINFDWRDIENTVFVQDVPPLPPNANSSDPSEFASTFDLVLRALYVQAGLDSLKQNGHLAIPLQQISNLRRGWDFSKVRVRLVPSLAGRHEGWPAVQRVGHTGLMTALRALGFKGEEKGKGGKVKLECQGSSIGTYTPPYLHEFLLSAHGSPSSAFQKWLDQSKSRRANLTNPSLEELAVLFPTANTVGQSVLGDAGGGTMFCRTNQWQGAKFPRQLFCDSRSRRGGVLMHTKMILALYSDATTASTPASTSTTARSPVDPDADTESESDSDVEIVEPPSSRSGAPARKGKEKATNGSVEGPVGWLYVGSHNFTSSAWGTLSGSGFTPVLNVTNYELGVVFPLKSMEDVERYVPWERPPKRYGMGDRPWIQDESTILADMYQ